MTIGSRLFAGLAAVAVLLAGLTALAPNVARAAPGDTRKAAAAIAIFTAATIAAFIIIDEENDDDEEQPQSP